MAPLSILPGRLRLESTALKGQRDLCQALVEALERLDGVAQASASFRTGRLLVSFDEEQLNRQQLTAAVEEILACGASVPCTGERPCPRVRQAAQKGVSGHVGRHLFVDLVTHAILPKPLHLLLPPAVAALRR